MPSVRYTSGKFAWLCRNINSFSLLQQSSWLFRNFGTTKNDEENDEETEVADDTNADAEATAENEAKPVAFIGDVGHRVSALAMETK